MMSSLSKEKSSQSVEVEKEIQQEPIKASVPSQPTLVKPPRPVALKYLSAQEFLLRKGVKPAHIPIYIAKAKNLGYTRATATEWDKLLFNVS